MKKLAKMKVELPHPWTMYFWPHNEWNNIQNMFTVNTIPTFWNWVNNFPTPKQVEGKANFAFFRNDIRPVWEDDVNVNGGKWSWCYDFDTTGETVDKHWLSLMLVVIGGTLYEKDLNEIHGITISTRLGGDRISVWTKTTCNETQIAIGTKLKQMFALRSIQFKSHKDAIVINSSYKSITQISI